eukprot:5147169-Alexandrium_andersonii.AAC.1
MRGRVLPGRLLAAGFTAGRGPRIPCTWARVSGRRRPGGPQGGGPGTQARPQHSVAIRKQPNFLQGGE